MRRLSPRVNVIPVIGKADSLTPLELAESKKLIMEDIEHYRIPVYVSPSEHCGALRGDLLMFNGTVTTSLMTSKKTTKTPSRRTPSSAASCLSPLLAPRRSLRWTVGESALGKHLLLPNPQSKTAPLIFGSSQYPWGTVEVDNPRHSDFLAIRSALLHSHLADLKEITHDFLYENYRTEKLSKSVSSPNDTAGGNAAVGDDGSLDPQSLASQSVRLKEEQLRREEEKLREIEVKVQREINEKRQELLARESQLKELESRMVSPTPLFYFLPLKSNTSVVRSFG